MKQNRFASFLPAAFAAALAFGSNCPTASAHGGNPRAWGIIVEPGNEKDIILRSDLFGFFRTQDGGATWQYVCSEVYGENSYQPLHVGLVLMPGGRIVVANPISGLYVSDDMCTWTEKSVFGTNVGIRDVIMNGTDLVAVTAAQRPGEDGQVAIVGQLWRSTDQGNTWTKVGGEMPPDFSPDTVAFAPSDPTRVYVAGQILYVASGAVEISKDSGTTWSRSVTNTMIPGGADGALRIDGVDPTNPDVVFLWNDGVEYATGDPTLDEIWYTTDGGKNGPSSWSKLLQGKGDLPGFALSPDNKTLLISGQYDGTQTAAVADVISTGPSALHQTFTGQMFGLNWRADGTVYSGGDDFNKPYCTMCSSTNASADFHPTMTLCDMSFPNQCADNTTVSQMCKTHGATPGPWDLPGSPGVGGLYQDYVQGPLCVGQNSIKNLSPDGGMKTGSSSPDGGTSTPQGGSSKSSGGCSYGPDSASSGAERLGLFGALSLASLVRRRRRNPAI